MKTIIKHLSLPEKATEADVLKAIKSIEADLKAAQSNSVSVEFAAKTIDEYEAKLKTQEVKILGLRKRIDKINK